MKCLLPALLLFAVTCRGDALKIAGSPVIARMAAEAAKVLQSEKQMEIEISTEGGSTAGLDALGEGTAHIAMISRHLSGEDRSRSPAVKLTEVSIGAQVVALAVSADVWAAGVRSITVAQMRQIYTGEVTNWKTLGGADQKISFFNWEERLGVWEMFANWLYGDARKAPPVDFQSLTTEFEARNAVEFTPGSMAPISPLFADGRLIFALAIKNDAGEAIEPTLANITAGKYPLARPLLLVVNDKPTGPVKVFVDFMLSPRAQPFFKKLGFFDAEALREPEAKAR